MQPPSGYNKGFDISKSDSVDFPSVESLGLTQAIYVGGAGIVAAVFQDGSVVNFTAVAGALLPLALRRVNDTNTTATLMVALYTV